MNHQLIENSVRQWVENVVVGLNLCPFAKKPFIKNRIRLTVTAVDREEQLLEVLWDELQLMQNNQEIETTLLIHPLVLSDFADYNEFLPVIDDFLRQIKMEGIFQIASFHPQYQFAGTQSDDVENYTNRSPYPILHILREDSLDIAIDNYAGIEQIPEHNIKLMQEMGLEKMQDLLRQLTEENG